MSNNQLGPCAYCGNATSSHDQYGLCCDYCNDFWDKNPKPPVPPPSGSVLIPLTEETIKALEK